MSVAIFAALCAMPERTFITKESSFRVYVCPGDGDAVGNAHLFRDLLLEREDLLPVAVEEGEKGSPAVPGRALAPGDGKAGELRFELL